MTSITTHRKNLFLVGDMVLVRGVTFTIKITNGPFEYGIGDATRTPKAQKQKAQWKRERAGRRS